MKRAEQREWLVKITYEVLSNQCEIEDIPQRLENYGLPRDNTYLNQSLLSLQEHRGEINQRIENRLVGWTLDRLSLVDRAILQVATNEILFMKDIPYAVTINECVDIAKRFSDDQAYRFINGVLSGIVSQQ